MANVRTLQRSFNGGELTPEMFGQINDAKYQAGLAPCRHFIVLPHGPVANRPGTAFVRAVKNSARRTRLIPFVYSTTQTMVIEMGDGYFRFHTQGATLMSGGVPYEIANPYAEADLFDIHYVQSADVLTLVHPNYKPKELRRLGATNWTLTDISFASQLSAPGSPAATSSGWPTTATGVMGQLTITVESTAGIALGQAVTGTGIGTGATVTNIKYSTGVITLSVANGAAVGGEVRFFGPTTYQYVVTAVGSTGIDESVATSPVSCSNNLLISGNYNTITWSAVTGASRYNVYKYFGGLFGYIGQTSGLSFTDQNITPDMSATPPIIQDPFNSAGNYPGAVSYFEQRRCFAGTLNLPQSLWMTRSGTEANLNYSIPTRDDDAISFRVAAREANTIRHIVPLQSLVLLTSSAEWRVTSVNSDAITPSSVSVRPQSYIGASNVQPVIINNNLIYAAARGGHMRELAYSWQASGFVTGDLSLRAPHLFDNLDIVDMAYAKAPQPIVWAVSSSGRLLGLTYVPEQQVGAWHRHDTDGVFESCTVVAEGNEDFLYVIVRRTVNGQSVRYVERMASRMWATQADAFYVDAGATYSGTPATTISGLTWLEGKTVNILADGAVHPQRVVTGGAITLDVAASKVQVGLPIEADVQSLPWNAQLDTALGQGRTKNVNKVYLRVNNSGSVFVGPDAANLIEYKQRTTEPYGSPPRLVSDEIMVLISPSWNNSGQVFVRQSNPLPITLVSMTLEVAVGS